MKNIKQYISRTLNDPLSSYFSSVNNALAALPIISVVAIALETVHSLQGEYGQVFHVIEYVILVVFATEYGLRIWTSEKKSAYIFGFFGIIDLLSIIPAPLFSSASPLVLRKVRILRILRLLRKVRTGIFLRYGDRKIRMHMTKEDVRKAATRVNMEIYFTALLSSIFLLATALFLAEKSQPAFENIPLAMLWTTEMLFGGSISGVVPVTYAGIIIVILIRFIGLVLFGLLINVIGNLVSQILFGTDLERVEKEE